MGTEEHLVDIVLYYINQQMRVLHLAAVHMLSKPYDMMFSSLLYWRRAAMARMTKRCQLGQYK